MRRRCGSVPNVALRVVPAKSTSRLEPGRVGGPKSYPAESRLPSCRGVPRLSTAIMTGALSGRGTTCVRRRDQLQTDSSTSTARASSVTLGDVRIARRRMCSHTQAVLVRSARPSMSCRFCAEAPFFCEVTQPDRGEPRAQRRCACGERSFRHVTDVPRRNGALAMLPWRSATLRFAAAHRARGMPSGQRKRAQIRRTRTHHRETDAETPDTSADSPTPPTGPTTSKTSTSDQQTSPLKQISSTCVRV